MARPERILLGDLLIQQGLLTPEKLNLALEDQKRSGRKLGRIVVEKGFVTEQAMCQALARQMQIPFVDLKNFPFKPDLVKQIPETQARRFRAIVLEDSPEGLPRVGLVDPADLLAYDKITQILKRPIDLAVIAEGQFLSTVDRLYRRTEAISGLAKELTAELGDAPIEFGDVLNQGTSADDAPVVKLLQTVFDEAVRLHASDIHFEPQKHALVIRFRIDGILHIQTEADSKIAPAVSLRLKLTAGLDIAEKRLPQDGRFSIKVRGNPVDIRLSSMPTQYGESMVMRLLEQNRGQKTLEHIGMPPALLTVFRKALKRPSGMIVVTGPTGSGKTTTLYSALSELNTPEKKIITVEDPVEYRLPGINQVQVNEKIDLSFGRVLRSALRQDPDIVLLGEMRDQETAEIGMRAAITGHLVLSTLHTNDALSTPIRLLDMGVPRFMVGMALHLVVAQRLIRLICPECKTHTTPTPQEYAWLNMVLGAEAGTIQAMRGTGCPNCHHSGYSGRAGVYEWLEMNHTLVDALNHHDPQHFIRTARPYIKNNTLHHDAIRLVRNGLSTIAEAMQVSNQLDD
jgi:MSHA biogenesis protein MshE